MIYQYQAYRTSKEIASGTIEAASEILAEKALYEAGFQYVLNLRTSPPRLSVHGLLPTLFGVKRPDIIEFSRQLAAFITSGSSLTSALQLMEEQITKPAMKELVAGLTKEIQGGSSFSQAINNYPGAFPHFYWQVIKTSEKTGDLETGLKQVADYLETQAMIANKIQRAVAYPIFVVVMAIGVMIMQMTLVLPPVIKLFASYKADLPQVTIFVIGTTNFFTNYKFHLLIGIIAIVCMMFLFRRLPGGRRALERLMLTMPMVGTIILYRNLGNFCRTTHMLLKTGLSLPEIMDVVIQTAGSNSIFIQALTNVQKRLLQGEGLAQPMVEDHLFPRMMVKMVATGEQTGTFESIFGTLSDFYERQTDQRIKSLITWIEPTLTVVVGMIVAIMLFAIIIPIYQIIGKVH